MQVRLKLIRKRERLPIWKDMALNPRFNLKEKIIQTNIKNLGVANPFSSKEIQCRIKETNKEKYGVEHVTAAPEIQEKIKQTNQPIKVWHTICQSATYFKRSIRKME
jgi:hypothetical protein